MSLESRIPNSGVRISQPPARTFQDLIVWQKAHDFVLAVVRFTENFLKREILESVSKLLNASASASAILNSDS